MVTTKTIYEAMTEYLQKTYPDEDIVEVVNIEETPYDRGGCDTCGHDIEIEMFITYTTKEENMYGSRRGYKTYNNLSLIDWIQRLTSDD